MQTVGAQWLIVSLGGTPLTVSLVQTATTLPTFLIGLPAGALGDIVDRRRVMLGSQAFMLVAAAALGALTLAHRIGIGTVLALTFAIGLGSAVLRPSWQAVQPELVGRDEIAQAAALNGVSMNMARAVGVGAVSGAFVLSAARARFSADAIVAGATLAFVATALVLGWVRSVPLVALALVLAGGAWIAVLSSLNASAQVALPAWVRARGMATYLLVFQGGQAAGSATWGALASRTSLPTALTVVGAGLVLALLVSSRRHRL